MNDPLYVLAWHQVGTVVSKLMLESVTLTNFVFCVMLLASSPPNKPLCVSAERLWYLLLARNDYIVFRSTSRLNTSASTSGYNTVSCLIPRSE